MEQRMLAALPDHEQRNRRLEAELAGSWRDGHVQVDGMAIAAWLLTHNDTDVGVATFTLVGLVDPHPLVDDFERRRRRTFTRSNR